MRKIMAISTLLFSILCMMSYGSEKEEQLQMSENETVSIVEIVGQRKDITSLTLDRYIEAEKNLNTKYAKEVSERINNDFEIRLESFHDNELGFFKSYVNMFRVVTSSERELQTYWDMANTNNFKSLTLYSDLEDLFSEHQKNVTALRKQIIESVNPNEIIKAEVDIPEYDVSTSKMTEHAYSNIWIEFFDLLILPFIVGIFFEVKSKDDKIFNFFYGMFMSLIIVVPISMGIDNKLLDSIRNQYNAEPIDYQSIQKQLDQSTDAYYDKIRL